MAKPMFIAISVATLAFGALALTGVGVGVGSGVARALPCSNDVTDVDYCGRVGGSSSGGGGGRSPFGTGPGQVDLTPGVTQNGPTDLTPGAGTTLTPGGGTNLTPGAGTAQPGSFDQHLAQDCPQPFSQQCAPRQGLTVSTNGPLFVTFTADGPPTACAPGKARIFVDGKQRGSAVVQPGQSDPGYHLNVAPGSHLVEVQMDGVLGGCNTGAMSGWSGNLHVETQ
jgi:hypothetical protein